MGVVLISGVQRIQECFEIGMIYDSGEIGIVRDVVDVGKF